MKRKTWLTVMSISAGALAGGPALAQLHAQDERALYLGGGVGVNDDTESTWRLFGGYRVNRNAAVELGYADLSEATIGGNTANADAWELSGLGMVPLGERFSAYGRLGFYRAEARGGGISETNIDLTFGLGAQYEVNRNVGVRLEWQRYADLGGGAFGGVTDQDVVWLNAIYRFR